MRRPDPNDGSNELRRHIVRGPPRPRKLWLPAGPARRAVSRFDGRRTAAIWSSHRQNARPVRWQRRPTRRRVCHRGAGSPGPDWSDQNGAEPAGRRQCGGDGWVLCACFSAGPGSSKSGQSEEGDGVTASWHGFLPWSSSNKRRARRPCRDRARPHCYGERSMRCRQTGRRGTMPSACRGVIIRALLHCRDGGASSSARLS